MDFELCELLDNGSVEEIGEYLSCYGKQYYNRKWKCYIVDNRRFYPVVVNGFIVDWEED